MATSGLAGIDTCLTLDRNMLLTTQMCSKYRRKTSNSEGKTVVFMHGGIPLGQIHG